MPRKLPRFLTPLEVAEMFKAAEASRRDSMLLKCLYYLGLRNSEAQNLLIGDIDIINKTVKVVQGKGFPLATLSQPFSSSIPIILGYLLSWSRIFMY